MLSFLGMLTTLVTHVYPRIFRKLEFFGEKVVEFLKKRYWDVLIFFFADCVWAKFLKKSLLNAPVKMYLTE